MRACNYDKFYDSIHTLFSYNIILWPAIPSSTSEGEDDTDSAPGIY